MADIPIQSFSKLSGIESSTLRYWETIGVFSPVGRNPNTNYRYYSKSQLLDLLFVTTLCTLNIPLKTTRELTLKRNPDCLLKLLEKKEKQLDYEMNCLLRNYSIIHTRRELINRGVNADAELLHVTPRDEKAIKIWPQNVCSESAALIEALASIISVAAEHHINLSYPIGGYFNNMESFENSPGLPNRFFTIDPDGLSKQHAGDFLTGYCRGYNNNPSELPGKMTAYANKNSLELYGPVYMEYLFDETCSTNPDEYLAGYSIAVKNNS